MKRKLLVSLVLLCGAGAVSRAQDVPAVDASEDAKRQQLNSAYTEAERNLTVRLLDRHLSQAKADAVLAADARAKMAAMQERLTGLKTNDEGKRLASNIDSITAGQLQRLMDEPPMPLATLQAIDRELQSATDELNKFRSNPPPGFVPPDSQQDELMKIAVTLTSGVARLNERAKWLDSLIAAAPATLDVSKSPTLDAAMKELVRRHQLDWNAAQRLGFDQAQPEAREQIAAAAKASELQRALAESRQMLQATMEELEQLRLEDAMRLAQERDDGKQREADLRQKLAVTVAARTVKDAQAERTVRQAQLDAQMIRKQQACHQPEVLASIAPFTAAGYWQPNSHRPSDQRQPMSLSSIRASGALSPDDAGLKALFQLGASRSDTLRPRWSFRTFNGNFTRTVNTPESFERLRKAQDTLTNYGDALVAEGLLAP